MKVIKLFFLFFMISILSFSQDQIDQSVSKIKIDFVDHVVKRKQTLFAISKLYDVSVDSIRKYNSTIKGDDLLKKTILKIPLISYSKSEKTESLKKNISVQNSQNMFISLIDSTPSVKSINFAFIAPFNLDKIEIDSLENTKKYLEKLNLSTLSLDFYSGTLCALEKAKKMGIRIQVDTYDNKNSIDEIDKISRSKKINDYDFILGPFIPRNIDRLSSNLLDSQVPIVSPLTSKEIKLNKNVFQSIPDLESQRNLIYSYVDSLIIKDPDPCVLIIYENETEHVKDKLLKKFPYAELIDVDLTNGLVDPEITDSLLVETKNNLVFLESQNLNVITSASSLFNSQISKDRNIKMLTTYRSEVYENENISYEHLGNLKFTYPTYFLPKYEEGLDDLNSIFYEKFGKFPGKIPIRAFEITLDLILRTAYKKKLIKSVDLGETKYLQNRFKYVKKDKGFVNESVFLIQHEDLDLLEISSDK